MIDQTELAICRKRGHHAPGLGFHLWEQCKWCGMWLREAKTIEEREDEPPKKEQNPLGKPIERNLQTTAERLSAIENRKH